MKWPGRDAWYALFYAGNQGLALLTTVFVIRYGQHSLSLPWVLGALLTLGWGVTLFGIVGPTLAARLWSASRREGMAAVTWTLTIAAAGLIAISLSHSAGAMLVDLAGLPLPWLLVFVMLGLLRACAQTLSTFSIRHGRHERVLRFQLAGRLVEIVLAVVAGIGGLAWLLILAWAAYPLAQLLLLVLEWSDYADASATAAATSDRRMVWLASAIGQASDLILPTTWLRLGGEETFVAYRAVTAALANSMMLPRYWYALSPDKPRDGGVGGGLLVAMIFTTLILATAFQFGSNAIGWEIFVWSLVPLLVVGLSTPYFSRLRQICLNNGQLLPPALALGIGRLAELAALLIAVGGGFASGSVIVAYSAFGASAPALYYLYRRNG